MADTIHLCGRPIPGGTSGGHCGKCHENFRGDAAFDKHLVRHKKNGSTYKVTCQELPGAVSPSGKPLEYWQDDTRFRAWHLGPRNDYWDQQDMEEEKEETA